MHPLIVLWPRFLVLAKLLYNLLCLYDRQSVRNAMGEMLFARLPLKTACLSVGHALKEVNLIFSFVIFVDVLYSLNFSFFYEN